MKVSVARLVAYALWGDAVFAQGIEVDHKDRNRANNRGDNLELLSQHQNTIRRSIRHGWYVVEEDGEPIAYCRHLDDVKCFENRRVTTHQV